MTITYGGSVFGGAGESSSAESGWAQYSDGQNTSASPLIIPQGSRVKLSNDASSIIDSQLPDGVVSFYDSVSQKITPDGIGDSYMLRVNFKAFTDRLN